MNKILFQYFSVYDILIIILYIIVSFLLSTSISRKYGKKFSSFFIILSIIHFLTTVYYIINSAYSIADSIAYYQNGLSIDFYEFDQGSIFVVYISSVLSNVFRLTYVGNMFFFSIIGLIGWFYLVKILISITHNKWHKSYYILLLPQLHFWTCALGKDSIMFFGICLFMYVWYSHKKIYYYIIPCLIIGFIRSHILMFILIAYVVSFLLQSKVNLFFRFIVSGVLIICMSLLLPIVTQRIGLNSVTSKDDIEEFTNIHSNVDNVSGSNLDLSNTNIFVKMFSYMFRPLFFDARSFLQLEASIENIFWLYMFVFMFKKNKFKYILSFPFICFLILLIAQSYILNNLGIAVRQKLMFFPAFFILFMQAIYNSKLLLSNKHH